jgi:hypothetical protein
VEKGFVVDFFFPIIPRMDWRRWMGSEWMRIGTNKEGMEEEALDDVWGGGSCWMDFWGMRRG